MPSSDNTSMWCRSRQEWEAWKTLCASLLKSGAITQADLDSPVGQKDTEGQRLLCDIRAWGDLLAALQIEE